MSLLKTHFYRLLRWSEQYTKTDMVYLAQGGMWSALGTGLAWPISFATVLAFANLLPKEIYGTYQYILSMVALLGVFGLSGMGTAIARATARGQDGALFDGLRAKMRWGLIGGTIAIAGGVYYLLQGNALLGWGFIIAGVFLPFWDATGLYINYAQGKKRFDITNLYDVGAQFIAAIAVIGVLFTSKNLLLLLFAYFGSWAAARAFFFYLTVRKLPPNDVHDPATISYGKHLTVMSAFSSVSVNIDTILLWQLVGPAAIASYVFAQAIPLRVAGSTKLVSRIAFPKMAVQDMQTMQRTLPYKVFLLLTPSALVAGMYALAAPYLFALFFPQYLEAVPLTQVLSLLIALQPLNIFMSPLTAHARQKLLYIYNLGLPLFRVAAFLLLIPLFGVWGAVWALVTIKAFDGLFLLWLFYRA